MNQVGYVIVLIDADGERTLPCFVHLVLSFTQVKNEPHDEVQIVHLFLSSVRLGTDCP